MNNIPLYLHEEDGQWWLTENERDHLKVSYRIKQIIHEERSPVQHIMILDSYDFGRMLVLDGIVQTTASDGYIYNEMIAHVPLSFHPDPKRVLIIGGGDCGVAKEACKYAEVKQIDMVEIDERVVSICREWLPEVSGRLNDPRVQFIFADGVQFAAEKKEEYDVIIVDSSDPVGPAVQLFEPPFYRSLQQALKPGGILVCQTESPVFHQDVLCRSFASIDQIFSGARLYTATVPTYPGGMWSFTLANKSPEPPTLSAVRPLPPDTLYATPELIQSSFDLPAFLRKLLERGRP